MPHQCTNCGKTFDDGSKQMLSGCPDCGGNKFQFKPSSAVRSSNESSDATESAASPQPVDPSPATEDGSPATDDKSSDRSGVAAKARSSVREWVGNRTSGDSDDSSNSDTESGTANADAETDAGDTDVSFPADEQSTAGASDPSPTDESTPPADSSSPPRPEPEPTVADDTEDHAQASARSDVVTPEELSAARDEAAASAGDAAKQPPAPDDADGTVIEPSSDERPDLSELREELNDQFESIKILSPGQYELNLMELYDRDEYIISLREDGRYVIEVADSWKHDDDR